MAITLAPIFMAFLEASTVSGVLPPREQVMIILSLPHAMQGVGPIRLYRLNPQLFCIALLKVIGRIKLCLGCAASYKDD